MSLVESSVIELHFENRDGQVRVVLPDSHIMAMSVDVAVHACRAYNEQILFKGQFDCLLDHLANWLSQRTAKIHEAYLTTRDSGLLFLVVMKATEFDAEFEDELTALDLEIANDSDYTLISLNVLAIPRSTDEDTRSFLSKKLLIRYKMNGE